MSSIPIFLKISFDINETIKENSLFLFVLPYEVNYRGGTRTNRLEGKARTGDQRLKKDELKLRR